MTTETLANIISILAICISLAGVALCIYSRVQERRVVAAITAARTRPPKTPPLMANRGADIKPVKHGRWEGAKNEIHCSVCGEYALEYGGEGGGQYVTMWCPFCGAKMDVKISRGVE